MNLLDKLFGKWERESEQMVTATYGSVFMKDRDRDVMLVVEVNSKTLKKRAYIKDIHGNKTSIDIDYLKEMTKK